ncbi:hypothetical protein BKA65DRAFT_497960 [Rhexocercosporidium sp. MPI-PUGE-AT-0058]|nr:hypothetical protein BKA65DRAFT_497960 [Rhexocercosporidium sp. MPI-PUGE-AT-0058]
MFTTSFKATKARLIKSCDEDEILELSPQCLPESYSLAELYGELVGHDEKQTANDELQNIFIIHSCLRESPRLQRKGGDEEYVAKLSLWISKVILPTAEIVIYDDAPEDSTNASRQKALHAVRRKGVLGLQSLLKLLTLSDHSQPSTAISNQILISILAFTSPRDIWSTPTSLSTTAELLAVPSIQRTLQEPEFIPADVLQRFIRPLFSASKPSTVTSAGRKAMPTSAPLKRYDFNEERANKPWMYEKVYAITILEWAVGAISTTTLQTTWPLILPPLLTILDTPATPILTRGLSLTTTLLPKLPLNALSQTGLASVFFDAIVPTTLHLPSITPLSESLEILPLAYEALFTLYDVQFSPLTSSPALPHKAQHSQIQIQLETTRSAAQEKARLAFLTTFLRKTILQTYLHASSHPPIVSLLILEFSTLITKMGIHFTKHLKDIMPILASVLTDPFMGARLDDVLGALRTFKVLVLNCWVRIREGWREEGVRMLVCAWVAVREIEGEGSMDGKRSALVEKVKEEIRVTGRVFAKAVEGREVDLREELMPLLDVDEGIGEIFGFRDLDT